MLGSFWGWLPGESQLRLFEEDASEGVLLRILIFPCNSIAKAQEGRDGQKRRGSTEFMQAIFARRRAHK